MRGGRRPDALGMSYQYLFCASCGLRRTGHGYRCTVCNGLLRHPVAAPAVHVGLPIETQPIQLGFQDRSGGLGSQTRQPVAA